MTKTELNQIKLDLTNWVPLTDIGKHFPNFSYPQLRRIFWKREEERYAGFSQCTKQVGKKVYINTSLFSWWLAGGFSAQLAQVNTIQHKQA